VELQKSCHTIKSKAKLFTLGYNLLAFPDLFSLTHNLCLGPQWRPSPQTPLLDADVYAQMAAVIVMPHFDHYRQPA